MRFVKHLPFAFLAFWLTACTNNHKRVSPKSFNVIIEEVKNKHQFPNLQSFVLGQGSNSSEWLILSGRTNGMHDFGKDNYEEKSFPIRNFNDTIWVYNYLEDKRYAFPVNKIDNPGSLLFKATNLQHFQDDNYLYLTGGYGENDSISNDNLLERFDTYADIARIDIDGMISDIVANASAEKVNTNIIYGFDKLARATGGELYKLDDYFYLAGGHVYKGIFSVKRNNTITPTSQKYLNSVHRFKLSEIDGRLKLSDFSKITDGFSDDSTQFRRRDLPVTPSINFNSDSSWEEGIAMYAGVFASPDNKINNINANGAWKWPIYIHKDGTYLIDSGFEQHTNIYSAPSFVAVDQNFKTVYTTIIGGIGSSNRAAYSNTTTTIIKNMEGNRVVYDTILQPPIPSENFYGAEAFMVLNKENRLNNAQLDVFDITQLIKNDKIEIGLFCGGIEAFVYNPGGNGKGKSKASNKIWKVTLVMR
jgi:hypothetical protein